MRSRPRVLVLAEAANPEWVSVPLVGWSLSTALAEVADVHLVTQIRNRDAILRQGLREGTDFTAIDSEAIAAPMHAIAGRLGSGKGVGWTLRTALGAVSHPYFERLVWKRFGADLEAKRFDIVHRVTPLSPTVASPLARRCNRAGVPFVLGPLNGGVPWPASFDRERRAEREYLSYVRGAYKINPVRSAMLNNAAAILAGSRHTEDELPARHRDRTIWMPENAIDPARFSIEAAAPQDGPLRACFVGRLVPYKGVDMVLNAGADLLRAGRMTLDIVGDGPEMPRLRALADTLGIAASVAFHGKVPHEAVQEILGKSHVLTFPSVREFGGGVVLEAMALGVVPLIVDYAGPGELVGERTGLKVPLGRREDIVGGLQAHLSRLAADRSELPPLSREAQRIVTRHYTWSAKARFVSRVYDWVLEGGDKPLFEPT